MLSSFISLLKFQPVLRTSSSVWHRSRELGDFNSILRCSVFCFNNLLWWCYFLFHFLITTLLINFHTCLWRY